MVPEGEFLVFTHFTEPTVAENSLRFAGLVAMADQLHPRTIQGRMEANRAAGIQLIDDMMTDLRARAFSPDFKPELTTPDVPDPGRVHDFINGKVQTKLKGETAQSVLRALEMTAKANRATLKSRGLPKSTALMARSMLAGYNQQRPATRWSPR